MIWVLERENLDGFQLVLDVSRDVVRDICGSGVVVCLAVEKTRERGGVLSESDPEGDGSV